ncbi:MAG: 1-acyl-sn-glycerol-3-phosphate acyltransferase [Propionibacteriaceae bacterium]|jgi:1-acyl-sn-glycerol-3-phosphate acyltransferase|nr:1-acyl-sn-glycerol-3-phosphate acyltransferase [Propionibacteriaceae bacterium]
MSSRTTDPKHYRSRLRSGLRLVTQDVLMHGTVWTMCKVEVHGKENLENVDAPYIVVANHSSHLDTPLIFGALPHRLSKHLATGAAADYWFENKLKGLATSAFFNIYPVERKGLRTRKGLTGQLLDEDIPLLIFPEGTRSRTGAMGRFTPGVAALSISRDLPILPVALVGAFAAWPYYQSLPPVNHPEVHVVFGHPLTPLPGEIAHEFADRMQRVIAELHNSTAKAYGLPTLDDYERAAVLKRAKSDELQAMVAQEQAEREAAEAKDEAKDESKGDAAPGDPDRAADA